MKILNNIILIALIVAICSIAFADEARFTDAISWFAINDPGTLPHEDSIEPPEFDSEPVDTPDAPVGAAAVSELTDADHRALLERSLAHLEERFPPVLVLTIDLPDGVEDEDIAIIEVELPFEGGVNMTKCIQIIPLETGASILTIASTVQEAIADLDFEYTVTATPDPDGILRFDATGLVALVDEGEIGNRFILRPFKGRDRFDARSISADAFSIVLGDEE